MKSLFSVFTAVFVLVTLCSSAGVAQESERIEYGFEDGAQGWRIPDWAFYQKDHVATDIGITTENASQGESSLEVMCDFPGKTWACALVEVEAQLDLSGYNTISADIYLPKKAPRDLIQARIILTVGDGWLFTEMRTPVLLERGKWTTVKVDIEKEDVEGISQWKGRKEKRLFLHIHNVKKVAIRIEYDAAPPTRVGPEYNGPIYIDNIVIE